MMNTDDERGSMSFAVARTRDEAHLYLDLNPCEDCGSTDSGWRQGLAEHDGELVINYSGVCAGCDAEREYWFGLPERELGGPFPFFGGPEESEIVDAGQWLAVADDAAGNVAIGDESAEAGHALAIARAAIEEVVKFVPPGADAVPADAFWTEDGCRLRDTDPGRFRLERLLVVRDSYTDLETEAGVN